MDRTNMPNTIILLLALWGLLLAPCWADQTSGWLFVLNCEPEVVERAALESPDHFVMTCDGDRLVIHCGTHQTWIPWELLDEHRDLWSVVHTGHHFRPTHIVSKGAKR